ncbi:unnamed protein product [Tilletia controversa]|uniref:RecA family profile 1 domain-containing protein n=3 Tax=Tilletia TaxID=13289 RepID=A0A8X7MYA4_9BASI|nr:hypothetical protein CF336_g1757 [Tilletia laevis]KAE8203312.1 hypothetical protein CF328_g1715 [Tilletia controversa]KAE8263980.1 hypothetical protein A4X03_0g1279 [Tilletia caries]KAE8252422.1 hypothetical protein A4X06_0g2198 [Tilletia controversa]CAD6888448.1 unnamed protein product [Tilletia caries]
MATPTIIDDIDGLTPKQRAHCRRAGIYSAEQLLLIPIGTIVKQCHVERAEATLIHRLAAISLGAPCTSAFHSFTGRTQPAFRALNPIHPQQDSNKFERFSSKTDGEPTIDLIDAIRSRTDRLEVVAATQGADEFDPAMQPSETQRVKPAYGFFGRSIAPWPVFSTTEDVVPGSQGDEENDAYADLARSSPPSVLAGLPTAEDVPQSPSMKALGKRRALDDDSGPPQRSKRRLIATSDDEDSASGSEERLQDVSEGKEARHWLTTADIQDAMSRMWLSTGDIRLDRILGGGIRRGTVTELVGESSSGKTQLALQLALHTVLGIKADEPDVRWDPSRRPSGVAILTPHGAAAASSLISRLVELATALPHCRSRNEREGDGRGGRRQNGDSLVSGNKGEEPTSEHVDVVLRNVHVACLGDADALDHALAYTLPGLQQRLQTCDERSKGPLELIIIEGLPAFLQDDTVDMNKFSGRFMRAKLLCSIADKLRCLSLNARARARTGGSNRATTDSCVRHEDYGPAILVINHVSDAFDREAAIVRAVLQEGYIGVHELQPQATVPAQERTLPSTLTISAQSAMDPPLAFDLQSIHSSGLLSTIPSSVGAAGIRPQRDASGHELPLDLDDFARALKGRVKFAQLGNVWTNCLNARLVLSRTSRRVPTSIIPSTWQTDKDVDKRKPKTQLRVLPVRRASLAFSSFTPSGIGSHANLDFVITSGRGLQSIPDEQDLDSLSLSHAQRRRSQHVKQDPTGSKGDDGLDMAFDDFDDGVGEELERLAFDMEMDAALASIPDYAASQEGHREEDDDEEEGEQGSAVPPPSSVLAPTQLLPSQQGGVVPASSLPIVADDGADCIIHHGGPSGDAAEVLEDSTTAPPDDDATQPLAFSQD